MRTNIIEQYRNGVLQKDELFIILARQVGESNSANDHEQLSEREKSDFIAWLRATLIRNVNIVAGGVGELFTAEEIKRVQTWFNEEYPTGHRG